MNKFNFFIFFCLSLLSCCVFAKADPIVAQRNLHFNNQCPFPVWFAFTSGTSDNLNGGSDCTVDADCVSGAICGSGKCRWAAPTPLNGQYKLAANGGSNSVSIPVYQNNIEKIWNGRAAGRTNCTAAGCETGDCEGGEGACPYGKGLEQPVTLAEFSLNKTKDDFYDISIVNGMNIPVEMRPIVSLKERSTLCHGKACDDAYECGSPGAVDPETLTGRCSWQMQPPHYELKHVSANGNACTSDSDCTAPNQCGLSVYSKVPKLRRTCGKLIGFWNPNEICGKDKTFGAPINCGQVLPAPQQNLTLYNLYKCNDISSCYKSDAINTCCGCANWDKLGIDVPPAPDTRLCTAINPTWVTEVQPKISWIKKACPTVYTYPYDDPSSTFTCKVLKNNMNSVDYTITFCPGGKTSGVSG